MAAFLLSKPYDPRPASGYAAADQPSTAPLLAVAIALGMAIRLYPALFASFPTGDGGLFLTMAQDIGHNHFALPAYTTYNHAHIPLAYPPLGLYVAAFLHRLTPMSLLTVMRFVPPIVTAGTMAAFAALAQALLRDGRATVAAVTLYGLLPDAYYAERMGAGITRAFGLLFALLTLWALARLFQSGRPSWVALAGLFGAATLLSHLEWSLFTGYSAVILLLGMGRRGDLRNISIAALLALALSAPWWLTVLMQHGPSPFLATLTNTSAIFPWYVAPAALLLMRWTEELLFPLGTALAALGLLLSALRHRWLLPSWLAATFLIESRAYVQRPVIVVSLLAGIAVAGVLLPLMSANPAGERETRRSAVSPLGIAALGLLGLYLLLNTAAWEASKTEVLSPADRTAMTWVSRHTSPSSRFLVVQPAEWGYANPVEWFPALSRRTGLTNVPGYEWISHVLASRERAQEDASRCADGSVPCLSSWLRRHHTGQGALIYIPRGPISILGGGTARCCQSLRSSLRRAPAYRRIYDAGGVEIYAHRGPGTHGRQA